MIFWPSLAAALFLLSMPFIRAESIENEEAGLWLVALSVALFGVAYGALS